MATLEQLWGNERFWSSTLIATWQSSPLIFSVPGQKNRLKGYVANDDSKRSAHRSEWPSDPAQMSSDVPLVSVCQDVAENPRYPIFLQPS